MSDKQISEFFDNLDPSDFARATSAVDTEKLAAPQRGAAAFVRFVDANVKGTMEGFNAQTPQVPWQSTAVLQCSDERRIFTPDDDETNNMFIKRLHREAKQMEAEWFFIAMLGPVAIVSGDNEEEVEAVMWYAEARESSFRHTRQGMISVDGMTCGINYEGDPEGAADMFREVLSREPVG